MVFVETWFMSVWDNSCSMTRKFNDIIRLKKQKQIFNLMIQINECHLCTSAIAKTETLKHL